MQGIWKSKSCNMHQNDFIQKRNELLYKMISGEPFTKEKKNQEFKKTQTSGKNPAERSDYTRPSI